MRDVLNDLGLRVDGHTKRTQCPIHGGDDKNFSVYEYGGCCWSQCGGKSWDTVELIRDLKKLSYPEALEELARIGGVEVKRSEERNPEQIAAAQKAEAYRQSLLATMKAALNIYRQDKPVVSEVDGKEVSNFVFDGRMLSAETVTAFLGPRTGPNQNDLLASTEKGMSAEAMLELGLLGQTSDGRRYDFFRNRILFPIQDHNGVLVGLAGRARKGSKQKAKYVNSKQSPIFDKSNLMYGLAQNRRNIHERGAILMEGYWDVLTCYDNNIRRCVAGMGTALTSGQLARLKRYTNKLTVVYDGDKAGIKAAIKAIPLALTMGFDVKVAFLPAIDPESKDKEWHDPDSYVRQVGAKAFIKLLDKAEDAFAWIMDHYCKSDDDDKINQALDLAADIFLDIKDQVRKVRYEGSAKEVLGSKLFKLLQTRIGVMEEKRDDERSRPVYTKEQVETINEYGIYLKNNRFYAAESITRHGMSITNFIVRPVMTVKGSSATNCLVEFINVRGQKASCEIDTDNLVEIGKFKNKALREGNYVFDEVAKPYHYTRILRWLMDQIPLCYPITTLGYHRKTGFYAWANGILQPEGKFVEVNEYGVVKYEQDHFYLPAFSKVNVGGKSDEDSNSYEDQRCFVYRPVLNSTCPSIYDWSKDFLAVHGNNGVVGLVFYTAAIFRTMIYNKFKCFPILNPFGPPGSGKSFLAWSLVAMFGEARKPFNVTDGTNVGFFRRLAQIRDGLVFLDEFSNGIDFKRYQALKNIYDGAGREKGVASQDNRTVTTQVNSAVVLCGQEQPAQDVALFSRTITLNFTPKNHSDEEKRRAKKFKKLEESACLSAITCKLLKHREQVRLRFDPIYDEIISKLSALVPKDAPKNVVARMVKNNAMILTAYKIISELESFALPYDKAQSVLAKIMVQQMYAISQEDDLANWWNIFEYLLSRSQIRHNKEFKAEMETEISVKKSKEKGNGPHTYTFEHPKKILYLNLNLCFRMYAEQAKREGNVNALNKEAIAHYLRGSEAYIGEKKLRLNGRVTPLFAFAVDHLPLDVQLTSEYMRERSMANNATPQDKNDSSSAKAGQAAA